MKKFIIIILTVLFSSYLQANTPNINECISDVYYANSIMTTKKDARTKRKLIKRKLLEEQYNNNLAKMDKELNFKTSYNRTHGSYGDIYDTYMFLSTEEDGWKTYENVMKLALEKGFGKGVDLATKIAKLSKKEKGLLDKLLDAIDVKSYLDIYSVDRSTDLSKQIADYRNSIRLGHGIILVAHGKGDLFTAKAYEDMLKPESGRDNTWMEEYISWMSVGSPTKDARGFHPYVNFDNDTLAYWSTLNATTNPNRSYIINALGEAVEQNSDMQFHSFDYYMGETIPFEDGYGQKNISTDIGKIIIMDFLSSSIQKHKDANSQWATDQELNKGTKDYKITLKHLYDTSITSMDGIKVYPFALEPSKKLYHVTDNTDGNGWVKASCGGEEVFDYWDGKKDDEAYKLKGTNELIALTKLKYDIVRFLFIGILKDGRGWSEREINAVSMVLIGSIDNNRTYTDDTVISGQSSSIDTIIEGSYYNNYSVYTGYTISKPFSIGGTRVLFETSDIEELKNLVDKGIPLFSTRFNFTQDMFNKLLK